MNYKFIGWCRDEKENTDKVWGVIELAQDVEAGTFSLYPKNKYITFWGRRGKKLQTKVSTDNEHDMEILIRSKEHKGYNSIDKNNLDTVYPEFQDDLEKTAVWGLLSA
jgi:predicted DNA-binding WGR domain protein